SPEGYEGVTIELDRPVERIAADFYSAAGLAQYGITPVAVFGFGQNESPGKAFDSEGVEVVGTDMELDIEALAVAEPDILVDFVPVKLGQSPDAMFAQYAAIARALGKDTETGEIADKAKAFEDARERIREVTAKKDGLTVLLANFSAEMNYTSKTSGIAEM